MRPVAHNWQTGAAGDIMPASPQYPWFLDKAKQILGHRTKQIWRHSKTTSTLAAGPCEEHRCVIKKIHVYLPVFSSCSREYEVYYKLSK